MDVCTKPTRSMKSGRVRRRRGRTTGRWTRAARRRRRRDVTMTGVLPSRSSRCRIMDPHTRPMTNRLLRFLPLFAIASAAANAQNTEKEFAARRDSLAKRIDSGVDVAVGRRPLLADFLTIFDEPDAAFVMVARKGVGHSTRFLTPSDPRRAFYYGWRPDSVSVKRYHNLDGRSFTALSGVIDSLARTGLPIYTLDDFEDPDFAAADSLTRGKLFVRALVARHPGLVVKNAHPIVDQLRARKSL